MTEMTILEIVIIYLACGSPFAVARFVQSQSYFSLRNALSSFGRLFVWPILVPRIMKQFVSRSHTEVNSSDEYDSDSHLSEIRKSLESQWCQAFGETKLATFCNDLEQYINVTLALRRCREVSSPEFEVLEIAEHTDSKVGSACLSRRSKQRLEVHLAASRTDVLEAIFRLDVAGNGEAIKDATELAKLIDDQDCLAELKSIRIVSSESSAMAA